MVGSQLELEVRDVLTKGLSKEGCNEEEEL